MNPAAGPADPLVDPPAPATFPWPPPPGTPAIHALFDTTAAALSRPASFYAVMPTGASPAPAALYLIILTCAGSGVRLFWEMLLPPPPWISPDLVTTGTDAAASFLLAGPIALALTLLAALLAHAGLIALTTRRERPRDTLAALCYASAANVLLFIPWLGPPLTAIAGLILAIIGLREVHRTSTARAAASILVPLLVLSFVIALGILVLLMLGFTAGWMLR